VVAREPLDRQVPPPGVVVAAVVAVVAAGCFTWFTTTFRLGH
jgi:hypothetical protein